MSPVDDAPPPVVAVAVASALELPLVALLGPPVPMLDVPGPSKSPASLGPEHAKATTTAAADAPIAGVLFMLRTMRRSVGGFNLGKHPNSTRCDNHSFARKPLRY